MNSRAVALNDLDIVAIIESAPGGGRLTESSAPCNRPAVDPANWLANNKFNTAFDYYELLVPVQTVSITHALLATASNLVFSSIGLSITIKGTQADRDIVLYAHGLGYVPTYMVAYNGARLPAGMHTIIRGSGTTSQRSRAISHWADTTNIYLREHCTSGDVDLEADTLSYQVLIFTRPARDPLVQDLLSYNDTTGVALIDHGRVRSDRHYLRKAIAAESSFDINLGATMDLNDGFVRVVTGGVIFDEPGYGGSWAGPPFVPVSGVY